METVYKDVVEMQRNFEVYGHVRVLSLLSLKRQVEGEMTLVRKKSCTESKLEAKFDLGELNVLETMHQKKQAI